MLHVIYIISCRSIPCIPSLVQQYLSSVDRRQMLNPFSSMVICLGSEAFPFVISWRDEVWSLLNWTSRETLLNKQYHENPELKRGWWNHTKRATSLLTLLLCATLGINKDITFTSSGKPSFLFSVIQWTVTHAFVWSFERTGSHGQI